MHAQPSRKTCRATGCPATSRFRLSATTPWTPPTTTSPPTCPPVPAMSLAFRLCNPGRWRHQQQLFLKKKCCGRLLLVDQTGGEGEESHPPHSRRVCWWRLVVKSSLMPKLDGGDENGRHGDAVVVLSCTSPGHVLKMSCPCPRVPVFGPKPIFVQTPTPIPSK